MHKYGREKMMPVGNHLAGKAVVVSGAGQGIGAACAVLAAQQGARVVLNDVDANALDDVVRKIRDDGGEAVAQPGDLGIWSDATALIDRCVDEFGAIDGLINNAGLFTISEIAELTEEKVKRIVGVNVHGVIAATIAAVKHMTRQGSGSIVNVTSASFMGSARLSLYGATKGAVTSFTYSCALDLDATGIRVNAVAPRAQTGITETMGQYVTQKSGRVLESRPTPESSAVPICFLLSDAARGINGQILTIDGDKLSTVDPAAISQPYSVGDWTFDAIASLVEAEPEWFDRPNGVIGRDRASGALQLLRAGEMHRPKS